eukprot:1116159-Alexandrium_andersonii.AAC.1
MKLRGSKVLLPLGGGAPRQVANGDDVFKSPRRRPGSLGLLTPSRRCARQDFSRQKAPPLRDPPVFGQAGQAS